MLTSKSIKTNKSIVHDFVRAYANLCGYVFTEKTCYENNRTYDIWRLEYPTKNAPSNFQSFMIGSFSLMEDDYERVYLTDILPILVNDVVRECCYAVEISICGSSAQVFAYHK